MNAEKKKKAILEELALLERMRKLHEWTVFGQEEAEDLEKAEEKLESEAPDSTTDQPEGE